MEENGAYRGCSVSVSAAYRCCSVLARQRLDEKEEEEVKKKKKPEALTENRNQKWKGATTTGSARLFSLKYMMKAATAAANVVVSLQAGLGRLTGEERETPNVKLEHEVPPTG